MKIVIKVGTQAILSPNGVVIDAMVSSIVEQIVELQKKGIEVLLVSSGAVSSGRRIARELLKREYGNSAGEKQVLASLGQPELMNMYALKFKQYDIAPAQILLTKQDFQTRAHYLNIARLLREILNQDKIIPIINENDSVSIEELMFTDNDELAGLLAAQIDADKLIILTSVQGVYDGHPDDTASKLIPVINKDDKWHQVSIVKTAHGRGGMVSKLATARKMSALGITTHIAHVNEPNGIVNIVNGESVGTVILPFKKKSSTKRWMAFSYGKNTGSITVNICLFNIMLENKKIISILPVGVEKITGEFEKGDLVDILAPDGKKIGIGIAKYGHKRLAEHQGLQGGSVFIHYDHLYLEKLR